MNPFRLLLHVPVPWVFILTYLGGVGLELFFPGSAHSPGTNFASTILGGVLFATGVAIAAWGWLIFHKARTTTIPGRSSSRLVTWGPYRFSRNPMYVGLVLAYLGEAGLLHQIWPVLLLPLTIFPTSTGLSFRSRRHGLTRSLRWNIKHIARKCGVGSRRCEGAIQPAAGPGFAATSQVCHVRHHSKLLSISGDGRKYAGTSCNR
jgi:hypothetical protein